MFWTVSNKEVADEDKVSCMLSVTGILVEKIKSLLKI